MILATASQDGTGVCIRLPQDPGQAGKAQASTYIRKLAGYDVKAAPVSGDKVARAAPASAQADAGNIRLPRGDWNDELLDELEAFPTGRQTTGSTRWPMRSTSWRWGRDTRWRTCSGTSNGAPWRASASGATNECPVVGGKPPGGGRIPEPSLLLRVDAAGKG